MKSPIVLVILFLGSFLYAQVADFNKNQLIIKFKPEVEISKYKDLDNRIFNVKEIDDLNRKYGLHSLRPTGDVRAEDTYLLTFHQEQNMTDIMEEYAGTGLLEYVEPNYIGHGAGKKGTMLLPNDVYYFRQYGLSNDGSFALSPSTVDADIDMDKAWDIEQGDSNIVVAVLDAGFRMGHPELAGRIWTNNDPANGIDDDNNSYIDDFQGWDFVNSDNDPTDDHGHGTNVTGIIAASGNNNIGYAGVDWNCKVMVCKILDQNNQGLYSWWAEAIYYAVDNGARILNMSVGGSANSATLRNAVNYAYNNGATVVVSMMNENNQVTYYPAGYQNSIAVGSTDANDQRSDPFFWSATSGSCYGSHIDVIAPGNYIYGLSYMSNSNYNTYWGGTSQAAPLVTGLCALLLAQNPNRTPDDLRNIIRATAEDQVGDPLEDTPGFDMYHGFGRINAFAALTQSFTGINEAGAHRLSIYPNPGSENLFLHSPEGIAQYELIDLRGKVVLQRDIPWFEEEVKLDVHTLNSGVYIIRVKEMLSNTSFSKKLIIR